MSNPIINKCQIYKQHFMTKHFCILKVVDSTMEKSQNLKHTTNDPPPLSIYCVSLYGNEFMCVSGGIRVHQFIVKDQKSSNFLKEPELSPLTCCSGSGSWCWLRNIWDCSKLVRFQFPKIK